MPLDFPDDPPVDYMFDAVGVRWRWDGLKWVTTNATGGTGNASGKDDVTRRAPTSRDDSAHGYAVGDLWLTGETVWNAEKVTPAFAVWRPVLAAAALPIDAVGGAAPAFAYGTMKLSSAFAGNAVNVVRPADSAALDIGFLAGGALDTAKLDAHARGAPVRVATFYDQSGGTNHATAVAALRPAMSPGNAIGPARSVVFDGVRAQSTGPADTGLTVPSLGGATTTAFSCLNLMRCSDSAGNDMFPIEAVGAPYGFFAGYSGSGELWVLNRTGAQLMNYNSRPRVTPSMFGFTLAPVATRFIVDDRIILSGGTGTGNTLTSATLGRSASQGATGCMHEMAVALAWARTLTDTEMLNARASLVRLFEYYPQIRGSVMCCGDSITAGTFQSVNVNHTRRVAPLIDPPMQIIANGRFGETMADMDANFDPWTDGVVNATHHNNILAIFAGTNDIAGGATAVVTWNHMKSFCAKARAAGWKVAVVTMLPRGGMSAAAQAEWASYVSLIRANWAANANALIDPAADDVIGPQSATANAALYQDGIHPADGMPVYFASLFARAINGLLA